MNGVVKRDGRIFKKIFVAFEDSGLIIKKIEDDSVLSAEDKSKLRVLFELIRNAKS
jgi:ribosomal protein S19E (S16A)